MFGLVVASHGHLAAELVATAEQIVGTLDRTAVCSVDPGASPEEIRKRMGEAIREVDDGAGVIVFADLIGGSPCTQSLSLCRDQKIEVLTGVNLPMLLKANSLRAVVQSLPELAHALAEYGRRNITCASDALRPALLRAPA
jgi:PTS system mannose-specific IIA component